MTSINEDYKKNIIEQNQKIGDFDTKLAEVSEESKISDEALKARIKAIDSALNGGGKRWIKIKKVRSIVKKQIAKSSYKKWMNIVELTRYSGAVVDASDEYDVPVPLILAVTRQESAFNPKAVSHAGAKGLMQLMPRTAKECAEGIGRKHVGIFEIETNVRLGTFYLRKMLTRFDEDTELAIKAYNAGPTYVSRVLAKEYKTYPAETIDYSERVLRYLEQYKASYN